MLSQAASGPGRLPGLSGGAACKLGTELSFVEATGAPQKAMGGSRLGVREPPTREWNVAQAGGSQRPGHRLGGRVASLRPGVARRAGLRRQGEGAGCQGSGVPPVDADPSTPDWSPTPVPVVCIPLVCTQSVLNNCWLGEQVRRRG